MPFNTHEPPFSRLLTSNDPRRDHPKSLVEFAYEQLLSMLMTMKLEPGAHIGIEALARELGISQTPIREALTLLEAQKLVHKIPNVGFRTANLLSREDVNALFEIRLLLEPAMAALAAERANDRTLKHLTLIAKKLELSSKGNETAYAQFAEGDAHLHQLIAAATGNRFIADANESLHIFRLLYKTNSTERAVTEHAKLIEALNARDPAAAEQAMREHLIASRDRLDNAMLAQEADK